MNAKKLLMIVLFATFGSLLMSCSEEEVEPTIEFPKALATEGDKGHEEGPGGL
ncbi:hypothetical protein LVD17_00110 [Fulvivirga ulvae]|uniref:hypothetical protein n=1 Tax=Fulvivirga ulvae TaxID=2904245 RepID=UPI001F394FF3|nr:hypothetical protein [Fulvivirga ulvae]UII32206.1 hypothetical protein LVD17_28375 [Fulvivirga ulvae]UII32239.1 hypothetical protein LVD17_00110 [Fulvivirga ulvae]